MVNAFGNTSDPVFLIADDKMSEINFDVHQVNGLGTTTAVSSKGYVCFFKSRAGNDKFFTWFNRTVVMEFLDEIRSFNHFDILGNPAYITFDGESIQIKPYFDEEIQSLFDNQNCYLGKLAASCTEIQQPCDVGNIFKGSKSANKNIDDSDVISHPLNMVIQDMIDSHELEKEKGNEMSSHKLMLRLGLLRVQRSLQIAVKTTTVQNSFTLTGMYPLDLDQTLSNCKADISSEEYKSISNSFPHLVDLFKENGKLTDQNINDIGVDSFIKLKTDKDKLVLSRQMAVQLSNIKIRDQNQIIKDKAIMKQKERRTMKTTTSSSKHKSYDSDRVAEDEVIPERQKSQRKKTKSLKAKEDNEFESDEDYNP